MRWRINGADRETGEPRELWVEAQTDQQARDQASKLGIMVSSVLSDPPVVFKAPDEVRIIRSQVRQLRVSDFRIACGVALGHFIFIGICVLIALLLFALGVFGAVEAAKGLSLIHNPI